MLCRLLTKEKRKALAWDKLRIGRAESQHSKKSKDGAEEPITDNEPEIKNVSSLESEETLKLSQKIEKDLKRLRYLKESRLARSIDDQAVEGLLSIMAEFNLFYKVDLITKKN